MIKEKAVKRIWGNNQRENFFRKKFILQEVPKNAKLKILVDTEYELYLNEFFIGRNRGCAIIDEYEISRYLKKGSNLIAVRGADHGGCKGLACEIRDFDTEKKSLIAATDKGWKCSGAYDKNWLREQYNDAHWKYAGIVTDLEPWRSPEDDIPETPDSLKSTPFGKNRRKRTQDRKEYPDVLKLIGEDYAKECNREIPDTNEAVRFESFTVKNAGYVYKKLSGVQGISKEADCVMIDFGMEVCGYLTINFSQPFTGNIHVAFGEIKKECEIEPPDEWLPKRWTVNDYFIDEEIEWRENLRQGFRYVKIEFKSDLPSFHIEKIYVKSSLYDVEFAGYFKCDDELLNRIWETGRYTLHLCMQEFYFDGIKRDRLLWVGDTYLENLINLYAFGDSDLFKYSWHCLARWQYNNGAIPAEGVDGGIIYIDYVAYWIMALYDYYFHTEDFDFLKLEYQTALRAVSYLESLTDEHGLIYKSENASPITTGVTLYGKGKGEELYLNCLYYQALVCMEEICRTMKENAKADKYRRQARLVKVAINRRLWDRDKGFYHSYRTRKEKSHLREMNAIAVRFGISDAERSKKILLDIKRNLWDSMGMGDSHCSFLLFNEIEARFKLGDGTDALELIRRHYKPELDEGATTFWENSVLSGKILPGKKFIEGSLCHGWSGGPTYSLLANVAGIIPRKAGFKEVSIVPMMGNLQWVKGVAPTPYGLLAVFHRKKGGSFKSSVYVPKGCFANFAIPDSNGKEVRITGGRFKKVEKDKYYTYLQLQDSGTIYEISCVDKV